MFFDMWPQIYNINIFHCSNKSNFFMRQFGHRLRMQSEATQESVATWMDKISRQLLHSVFSVALNGNKLVIYSVKLFIEHQIKGAKMVYLGSKMNKSGFPVNLLCSLSSSAVKCMPFNSRVEWCAKKMFLSSMWGWIWLLGFGLCGICRVAIWINSNVTESDWVC